MLEELETVAARLAVKVSYEALAASVGSGGLCRVKGEYRVIIDKRAQTGERIAALAQALGRLPMLTPILTQAAPARAAKGTAPPAPSPSSDVVAAGDQAVQLSRPIRELLRRYQALRRAS
jgi:hypothetical protein